MPSLPEPRSEIETNSKMTLNSDGTSVLRIDSWQGSTIRLNSLEIFSFYQNLDKTLLFVSL